METTTNWTRQEFKTYLLLYCAQADFEESEDEIDAIKEQIGEKTFKSIHKELDHDNDYQSIQKIQYNLKKFNYSSEEKDKLIEDIKNLFFVDGEFNILEKNLLLNLKHIM